MSEVVGYLAMILTVLLYVLSVCSFIAGLLFIRNVFNWLGQR